METKFNINDLKNDTETLINKAPEQTDHKRILKELLSRIEPIDFDLVAFPQRENLELRLREIEKLTLSNDCKNRDSLKDERERIEKDLSKMFTKEKHKIIITIEEMHSLAYKNKWELCKNNDFIYLYNGAYWDNLDKSELECFLGEASERFSVSKYDARFFPFREKLFKQFMSASYLPTPTQNNNTVLINLKNGTFEITPKETILKPFNADDFLTYQLPFDYNPNATAPIFTAYLNRVLPDKQAQNILAEFLGYVFTDTSTLKLEKALLLYGDGANGKSVFFEVVTALLGIENTSNHSLENLTNETGYHRATIANKLVNYASELNGKLEASIFKQLVSGEPVVARLPYGNPFTIRKYAKLIFNCNKLPSDVEHTNAYFRRFLIIPFDVTIPENERDSELPQRIINSELSGVFNWVLDGLKRILENKKFSESEQVKQALENYKKHSDSVKMFLDDNAYVIDTNELKPLKELYNEYKIYCLECGYRVTSINTFSDRLKKGLGFETTRLSYGNAVYMKKSFIF
ncbi:MAG: phage/plasmid primase, P4 family [Bacteroidota bacterium]